MKRFLIFASVCAFALTVFQSGRADVSVNFFYDNLNGGNWYEVGDYGYVWQPDAATNPDWRPYTDGYWAYTDVGWTWVSYEDFGWATYHYGRWIRLTDYGWCWVPGYEWGPAWVSWRTGGDYIGWAPLPPAGSEVVYESRPIGGHVDVEFGIGPAYYNFIDIRFIGEPVLIGHYYPYTQNVVYINNTVNVTNITYNNSVVYNYGPDYAVLSRYSTRPIQRLKLERTSMDPLQAVKGGNVTKVQGDKLVLAAPMKLQKANTQVAPKAVKAKITQPKVEKGWANISDPGAKAKLEQKIKSENPKNVPPPSIQPNTGSNVNAQASPGVPPFEKGKHKGEMLENQAGVTAGSPPAATAMPFEQGKKGKGQKFETGAGATAAPGTQSFEQGKGKHKDKRFENESTVSGGSGSSPADYEQGKGKKKGRERGDQTPNYGPTITPQNPNANRGNQSNPEGGNQKGNPYNQYNPPGSQNAGSGPAPGGYGGGGNKHRDQQIQSQGQPQSGQYGQQSGRQGGQQTGQQAGQQGGRQAGQQGGQEGGQQQDGQGKGKGKKGESPTPPPQ